MKPIRGKNRNANLLQIQRNEPRVTLSHLLGPGVPEPTYDGGFILLGLDMAGNLAVVLDQKREDLWACSDHQCPGGGGMNDPFPDGCDLLMSD